MELSKNIDKSQEVKMEKGTTGGHGIDLSRNGRPLPIGRLGPEIDNPPPPGMNDFYRLDCRPGASARKRTKRRA
jgi:hypothetical protein